jgi:ribulose-bisphosphate carboxylase large chain
LNATRIRASYILETAIPPEKAASIIAGEQSSGTFLPVPGEDDALKARASADFNIESITHVVPGPAPAVQAYQLNLSWPVDTVGLSLPQVMATVAGNLYELKHVVSLRLMDIELPEIFSSVYSGPAFGITGTRQLCQITERPLLGTIIKPSVGLSADQTAAMVDQLCAAGIDFIKDDELQADGASCPFDERAKKVMAVINRHAEKTGRKVMYAFNITGELDDMKRRHDLVRALGGTCVMLSLNSVGLSGFTAFRRHASLPIHAHRNGWGYLSRHWSYVAWQKVWRLAGVDHMHVNGLDNKFQEENTSVMASARACLTPLFADLPCLAMPVFSSGQSAKQVQHTLKLLGSTDLLYLAGGGLFAHPGGIAAGVSALRQAWDAASAGVSLDTAAMSHRELREALDTFGR